MYIYSQLYLVLWLLCLLFECVIVLWRLLIFIFNHFPSFVYIKKKKRERFYRVKVGESREFIWSETINFRNQTITIRIWCTLLQNLLHTYAFSNKKVIMITQHCVYIYVRACMRVCLGCMSIFKSSQKFI